MKLKFTCLLLVLSLTVGYSQVTITEAPDFTVTDIHGEVHNLYSILDEGKHVMVDLFAYWCGPCCSNAPNIKQTYEEYGCNTGDLYVIALEADGTTAQTENFEVSCGSEGGAPVASGLDGGGSEAVAAFGPAAYPTIILIAPDRTIIEQDIWPYTNAGVDEIMDALNIEKQECSAPVSVNELIVGELSLTPNPVQDNTQLEFHLAEASEVQVDIVDITGALVSNVFTGEIANGYHNMSINTTDLAQGAYFVKTTINGVENQSIKMIKMD